MYLLFNTTTILVSHNFVEISFPLPVHEQRMANSLLKMLARTLFKLSLTAFPPIDIKKFS